MRNQCARTVLVLARAHAAPAEQFLRDKIPIEPARKTEENFFKLGLLVVDALGALFKAIHPITIPPSESVTAPRYAHVVCAGQWEGSSIYPGQSVYSNRIHRLIFTFTYPQKSSPLPSPRLMSSLPPPSLLSAQLRIIICFSSDDNTH